jgi:thymidine kinase
MNWIKNSSYLKLYIGPMYASKSSSLISEINRYSHITDRILVINNKLDNQRHPEPINEQGIGIIKTHDSKVFQAIMVNKLSEINESNFFHNKYNRSDIIIIDEGQFYPDLYEFIRNELELVDSNKMFIIAGLSGDSNMEPIGDILKLIPMADSVEFLKAFCVYCKDGQLASFTKRLTIQDNSQILVGANETYSPVCRYHYNTL